MKIHFKKENILPVALIIAFFAGFLILGLSIYRDYGTHIDEYAQVEIGRLNYEFLKTGDAQKLNFRDWEHGAVFEVFTVLTQRFLPKNWHYWDMLYLRHLDVYLTFWASAIAFFWLVKKKFNSWVIGLAGSTFLFFSPVIFGNAFYNSKDIPLLSFYIFGLLTLTFFLERPNLFTAALHALVCAILVDIRIPGIILPAITIGLLGLQVIVPNHSQFQPSRRNTLFTGAVFLLLTAALITLFFPASWSNPIQRFYDAYVAMNHRSWTCCFNLFMGQRFTSENIPWYYIPGWIGVSTPLYYVILFLVGTVVSLGTFLARPYLHLTSEKRSALIYLSALFLPLLAIIIGRSVVYNGWRHLYFIYAPFLILAMDGLVALLRLLKTRLRPQLANGLVVLITLVSLIATGRTMIARHPYENLYFNLLAGQNMSEISQRFELDYWGLSYVEGMRYLLAHDTRPVITLATPLREMSLYGLLLTQAEQDRFNFTTDLTGADYYMATHYLHPEDYNFPDEVFSVKVEGAKILSVFKIKK